MRDGTHKKELKGTRGTDRREAQDEAGEGSQSTSNREKIGATRARGTERCSGPGPKGCWRSSGV